MNKLVQSDNKQRVVALENLKAILRRINGMSHRFWIEKLTNRYCYVGYSNPDEYGNESPMIAIYPLYKNTWDGNKDNPFIVLDLTNILYDNWDGEGWQAFSCISDHDILWRDPDNNEWKTREEIEGENK